MSFVVSHIESILLCFFPDLASLLEQHLLLKYLNSERVCLLYVGWYMFIVLCPILQCFMLGAY